jgi:hypothetical protein
VSWLIAIFAGLGVGFCVGMAIQKWRFTDFYSDLSKHWEERSNLWRLKFEEMERKYDEERARPMVKPPRRFQ